MDGKIANVDEVKIYHCFWVGFMRFGASRCKFTKPSEVGNIPRSTDQVQIFKSIYVTFSNKAREEMIWWKPVTSKAKSMHPVRGILV